MAGISTVSFWLLLMGFLLPPGVRQVQGVRPSHPMTHRDRLFLLRSFHPAPTGTVGSLPSWSTQTQPYCVLLGFGCSRYSSRSWVNLSALIARRFALGSMPKTLAAFRPRIWSLIWSVSSGYLYLSMNSGFMISLRSRTI